MAKQAVGGQAVVEGVMMRTPSAWAVSIRRPDGRITTVVRDSTSVALRHPILRLPVIRGVVALGESLAIGMRALSLSAQLSATDDEHEGEEGEAATSARRRSPLPSGSRSSSASRSSRWSRAWPPA